MRKFKFTMESLLKIKISLEKQLKNKLTEAEIKMSNCIRELDEIVKFKENLRTNIKDKTHETNSLELKVFNEFYREVEKRRLNQVIAVENARKEFFQVQKELLVVMSERKMYEKLKEKEYDNYLFELKKETDKELDDILSYKITKAGEVEV